MIIIRLANQTLPLLLFAHPGMMLSGSAKLAAPLAATIAERFTITIIKTIHMPNLPHFRPSPVEDLFDFSKCFRKYDFKCHHLHPPSPLSS